MFLSTSLNLILLALPSAFAVDKFYQFNVANGVVAPDGFSRSAVLVNGIYPGTTIVANKGDRLLLNVSNTLTDPNMRRSTTIHWHGLFQATTGTEDGPAFVNQCPIAPQHFYQYTIPTHGQTGTFWYHSHLSSQYVDGLRGALVIYDPNDPHKSLYDVDDESTIISVGDWYHAPAIGLTESYFATNNGGGQEPVPASGLINGKGRYKNGPASPRAVINVTAGKRYRFRLINNAAFGQFRFSVEGHRMTIIEVDGVSHQPYTVDSLDIYAAQRYSFVLTANQPVKNYWIRSPMTVSGASDNKDLDADDVFAVLHYAGAPNAEPTTAKGSGGGLLLKENQLKALENPGAPGGSAPADRVIDLDFTKTKDAQGRVSWTINDVQYLPPTLPTMLRILQGATTEADFPKSEDTFVLAPNIVVELRIAESLHGITHPFHLHGHAFDVVKSSDGGGTNYVDPPRRDVIGVGGGGVIIRFRTDNPGPWFLHCHIDWHLEAGLAVVFAEDPAGQRSGPKAVVIPPAWSQLCPIYNALPPALQ